MPANSQIGVTTSNLETTSASAAQSTTAAPITTVAPGNPVTVFPGNGIPTSISMPTDRPTPVIFAPTHAANPGGSDDAPVIEVGGIPPANGGDTSGDRPASTETASGDGNNNNGSTQPNNNPFDTPPTGNSNNVAQGSNLSNVGTIAGITAGIAFVIIGGLVFALRRGRQADSEVGGNGGSVDGMGYGASKRALDDDFGGSFSTPPAAAPLPEVRGVSPSLARSFENSFNARYPDQPLPPTAWHNSPSSPPALVRAGPTSPLPPLPSVASATDLTTRNVVEVEEEHYSYSPATNASRDTFASTYSDVAPVLNTYLAQVRESNQSGTPPTLDYATPDRHISALTDATFMTEETADESSYRDRRHDSLMTRDSMISQGTFDENGGNGGLYESPLLKLVNERGDGDIADQGIAREEVVQQRGKTPSANVNAQAAHIAAAATFAASVPSPMMKTALPTHMNVSPNGTLNSTHSTRPMPHLTQSPSQQPHSIFHDSASDEYAFSDTQSNYSRDTADRQYRRFESVYTAANRDSTGSGSSHQYSVSSSMEEGYGGDLRMNTGNSNRSWTESDDEEENRSVVVLEHEGSSPEKEGGLTVDHAERVARAYRGAWRNTLTSDVGTMRSFETRSEDGVLD
ncbi:hypothetical protein HK097_003389, partial [Rhizophlyctis rosea]